MEYMKASELIEELKKFPPNEKVIVFSKKDSIPYYVKQVFNDKRFNGVFSYILIENIEE